MTAVTLELAPALQRLVDERLDSIDRVLQRAGLSRSERQSAVAEVDSQIHEMLAQRAPAGPERHDLIAVLSQLDPPEAFIPEETVASAFSSPVLAHRQTPTSPIGSTPITSSQPLFAAPGAVQAAPVQAQPVPTAAQPQVSILALCSAAAGMVGGLSIIGVIVGYLYDSEVVALLCGMFALLMGILATTGGVASIFRIRQSNGLEFGLPAAVFATMFLPLALLNLALLFVAMIFEELAVFPSLGLNILLTNGMLIYVVWRFLAGRMKRA
jgi:hypothetical protein